MDQYTITEKSFYKYLKCPSWIVHEGKSKKAPHAFIELIQDEALLSEERKQLLAQDGCREVTSDDTDEAAQETLELMREGAPCIVRPVLIHGHYVASPDMLKKIEGKSDFGDYYYVATDLKRSKHLKDEYKLQGAFYAEVLHIVQGVKPYMGYVLHKDGRLDAYLIEDTEEKFQVTLERIEKILAGEESEPFLTSACKQSPWFHACVAEVESVRHLSLINRIWRSEVDALKRANVQTVDDLAALPDDRIIEVSGIPEDRLKFLREQARTVASGEVKFIGPVELPHGEHNLYIDIESDPLKGGHYLFGVLVEGNGKSEYHAFFAENPEDEEMNWRAFLAFLEPFKGAPLYHYGWFERDVFRDLIEKYGASEAAEDQLENDTVDLIAEMREHILFPSPFYSLKDISAHLGFKWRIDGASGLDSIVWYHDWLASKDAAVKEKIEIYNEDDVRATAFVADWVKKETKKRYG
jgi:uncharacterized protein